MQMSLVPKFFPLHMEEINYVFQSYTLNIL